MDFNPYMTALFVPWSLLALRHARNLRQASRLSLLETCAHFAVWCAVYWPLSEDTCMRLTHYSSKRRLRELMQTFGPMLCALAAVGVHCAASLFLYVYEGLCARLLGMQRAQFMLHVVLTLLAYDSTWEARCTVYALVIACRCRAWPDTKSRLALALHVWIVLSSVGVYARMLGSALAAMMFVLP